MGVSSVLRMAIVLKQEPGLDKGKTHLKTKLFLRIFKYLAYSV
jgi:hypothetical protein